MGQREWRFVLADSGYWELYRNGTLVDEAEPPMTPEAMGEWFAKWLEDEPNYDAGSNGEAHGGA